MKSEIYTRLLKLTSCPSITETQGERDMAIGIYEMLGENPYFQSHPDHLLLHSIEKYNLYGVMALLKHPKSTNKTVILISHFDVVGVEEFGFLKDYAFDAEAYTEKLKEVKLPPEVQEDLHSGQWLFGRGTMDMKCGLAIHMELLKHYSSNFEALDCNLLLLTVPDEEGNSKGMLGCAPKLAEWVAQYELDYQVVINTEPFFPLYTGDTRKYLYTGSVGKLLPMFFCVGKETHVGEPYSGFNPNLILSEIHRLLEVNPEYCEKLGDFVSPPPTCLKHKDLKDAYSVQIPRTAVAYYNWIVLQDGPEAVLEKMKKIAYDAAATVLKERQNRLTQFKQLSSYRIEDSKWQIDVKTFAEVFQIVLDTHGNHFQHHLDHQISQWMASGIRDERELTIRIVDETYSYYPDKNPLIILLFAPPYYPSALNENNTEKEKKVLQEIQDLIQYSKDQFGVEFFCCPTFPGLSDNSYFGIKNGTKITEALKPNMPVWGISYDLPAEALEQLNVPVINIGVLGKDAHKYTERLHLPFSLEVTPKLLMYYLERL